MTVVALVPARGGSKTIPRKNVRDLCGKPLLAWTVEDAHQASTVDRVVVSTDDEEIAATARRWGAETPFLRPRALGRDDVPTWMVTEHAIAALDLRADDAIVVLHPTSPLRIPADIDACVRKLDGADECRSVTHADQHPYLLFHQNMGGRLRPYTEFSWRDRPPRQQWPDLYLDNGAVWARRVVPYSDPSMLVGYEMPPSRSIDIDNELDWRMAEMLMWERKQVAA